MPEVQSPAQSPATPLPVQSPARPSFSAHPRELSHEEELEDEVVDLRTQRAAAIAEGGGGGGAAAQPQPDPPSDRTPPRRSWRRLALAAPDHGARFPPWYCNVGPANHPAYNRIIRESAPGTFLAHEAPVAGGGATTVELYANCQGVAKQCTIRVKQINNVRVYDFNDTDFDSVEQAVQYTLQTLNHGTPF